MSKEGDSIVLDTLRAAGCDIPSDVESIKQVTCELMVRTATALLRKFPDDGRPDEVDRLPAVLGASVAARHRQCALLAKIVSESLGYTGNCGYNQFLYPTGSDTRKILLFLVESLPKKEEDEGADADALLSAGGESQLNRQMHGALRAWKKTLWTPEFVFASAAELRLREL